MFSELVKLSVQHYCGQYACCQVGYRHAYPYAMRTEKQWQDEQTWYKNQNLAAQRQDNGFSCHPNALEKV